MLGSAIAWIFIPLGWGDWQSTVAMLTGLVAKENVVGTFGVLFQQTDAPDASLYTTIATHYSALAGYSFLVFNLLCAPCFAAIGAIRREMNNAKWFWMAIGYQCGYAYIVSLVVYQVGRLVAGIL
jgi:ferrous iron transport protein B